MHQSVVVMASSNALQLDLKIRDKNMLIPASPKPPPDYGTKLPHFGGQGRQSSRRSLELECRAGPLLRNVPVNKQKVQK